MFVLLTLMLLRSLTSETHVANLCKKANQKLHAKSLKSFKEKIKQRYQIDARVSK